MVCNMANLRELAMRNVWKAEILLKNKFSVPDSSIHMFSDKFAKFHFKQLKTARGVDYTEYAVEAVWSLKLLRSITLTLPTLSAFPHI